MKAFLTSRVGVVSVAAFALLMAFMFYRVTQRRKSSEPLPAATRNTPAAPSRVVAEARPASAAVMADAVVENAAYLDQYADFGKRTQADHDRQGNGVTRRKSAGTPSDSGKETENEVPRVAAKKTIRASSRLAGKPGGREAPALRPPLAPALGQALPPASGGASRAEPAAQTSRTAAPRSTRFNPYGRVIKCELVFTLDSTNEQTPLVALVVEPVYNNGVLVIPAGAELHGMARPDRLRDRIFSGQEWVLVFPREDQRLNGRQLNVRGVALNRVEPDANGMTWGLTDGSYGLEGRVVRSSDAAEIKRFVASFLAAGTTTLEERSSGRAGQQSVRNTPQNAVLQGLAANFEKLTEEITAEIEHHGVFIRVPAGHQFYFYPMQIIDADVAGISADVATVK